jgi:ABC-type branched-subunit amino acid transport system ATPase component
MPGPINGNETKGEAPLLKIENLSINFGGVKALDRVNMEVRQGEIRGLIGPNGSGKSTLLNIVSRIYNPSEGTIHLDGEDLLKCKAHHMPQKGLGRTFQNLELFKNMSAIQNLLVSQTVNQTYSIFSSAFFTPGFRRLEQESYDNAMEALKMVGLENLYKRQAQDLSFGQQKLLELARTLVFKPKLIMLDEPAAGLSPVMVKQFVDIVDEFWRRYNLTVVIVEHMTKLVMDIADRVTVLNYGQVIAEGTPAEIMSDRKVIDVYLGRGIKEAFTPEFEREEITVTAGESPDSELEPLHPEPAPASEPAVTRQDEAPNGFKGLKVEGIDAYYGKLQVLNDVSLKVPQGSIVALLGGNGSGKSTTLKAISGLVKVKKGIVEYDGMTLPRKHPHRIVRMGVVQVPQHREVFPYLTVKENLAMGAYRRRDKKGIRNDYDRVLNYFPRLGERHKQLAASMSGGEQQMLAIGRALMANPSILLMDEPSASLAPTLVEEIFEKLVEINNDGTTLFIIEQNVDVALSVAQYVYILRQGEIVMEDRVDNIKNDDEIISTYFGTQKK